MMRKKLMAAFAIFGLPAAAIAHEGASLPYGSFIGGLTHPVLGLDHFLFEDQLEDVKLSRGYSFDTDLGADDLAGLIET